MGFFDWDSYVFKKWKQYKNVVLQCVISPRNTGKTYATHHKILKDGGFTPKHKVLFLRNTDTELKQSKRDFQARYKGKFIVKGDFIFEERVDEFENKNGETILKYKTGELVGYFASINNFVNYKSLEAKDVSYIFYEEFNEETVIGKSLYIKFFNMIKTFERFNNLRYIFMLGNKDGFDSDYFVNWGVIPPDKIENKITEIKDDYGVIGVVYDLCDDDFSDLQNQKTISNRLAMFDNRTANFALGGYLKSHCKRVINHKDITPTFTPKFRLSVGENSYYFGEFEKGTCILSPWNYQTKEELIDYSFDLFSGILHDSKILDNDDQLELLNYIFKLEKNNHLFYDSYDVRNEFIMLLVVNKKNIQKNIS